MSFVLVMVKAPVPGRVKTRLCPPCTPEEAALVAEAAVADTLDAVTGCRADRRIVALDGDAGPWLPPGFEVIAQRGAGLAERLANAWLDARAAGAAGAAGGGEAGEPGIQIGMDTPQVTSADLDRLLALVGPARAVLGHALDGGWWVIGLPGALADPTAVFSGVAMSTPSTGKQQEERLRSLGFSVRLAERRRDVDTFDDLLVVAAITPGTRTAAVATALAPV